MRVQHGGDDDDDAEEHDNTLYEVVHRRCLIPSEDDIDGGEDCHDHHAVLVGNTESHLEEGGDAFIDTGGIGNQEDEGDDGGYHAQSLTVETCSEEVGHGTALDMLCHQFRAAT